jgi:hypothetical protein
MAAVLAGGSVYGFVRDPFTAVWALGVGVRLLQRGKFGFLGHRFSFLSGKFIPHVDSHKPDSFG